MAKDFTSRTDEGLKQAKAAADNLGLWSVIHNAGSGEHLHIQGLKPGAVPVWWSSKYAEGESK